ncbi:F-box protein [Senna tora]|uniref:F-box protein n=1 Tax=Senna tora TaxID=362788 RepID=A0A834WN83_9FABA|nr:F-box protein [Senna tora]
MGKVSPKEEGCKRTRQRRQLQSSSSKNLKPGALAQLRYNKSSTSKSCMNFGNKRVAISNCSKTENSVVVPEDKVYDESPLMLSPVNLVKQNNLLGTPKTPRIEGCPSESRLESLPMDLLVCTCLLHFLSSFSFGCGANSFFFHKFEVKILCHLHHDQLRAVFHVSQTIRNAVLFARQYHFNYTTPDRSRQEMLRTTTPCLSEHWPSLCLCNGDGKGTSISSPHTPKAPRHGPRPPSRLKVSEMRQIAAVLFPESAFPSRCNIQSVLPKPLSRTLASNRVLFYEDELCQAVSQNKLR